MSPRLGEAASRYADGALEAARQTGMAFYGAMAHYAKALVDAHLGRVEPARRAAEEGLRIAERTGVAITKALNLSVLGFLVLSKGEFGSAHGYLAQAVELAVSMGVGDPGFLHHLPDEIESLIALGRLEEARPGSNPSSSLLGSWTGRGPGRQLPCAAGCSKQLRGTSPERFARSTRPC